MAASASMPSRFSRLATMSRRPSQLETWPRAFDPGVELDWGDPVVSRRLLREHLDQAHDGASRRLRIIDDQVRRLLRLLPRPPAHVLDAACGPGLYSVRLAGAGHRVTALDIGPAVVGHARRLARQQGVADLVTARVADLRRFEERAEYDAALLIYHVLEGFPRREQPGVLRRLAASLRRGAPLIVEMRLRPDQPDGRISSFDVVPASLLSDRRHLLLVETVHERSRNTFVLRETAVFDDGSTAVQQTSSALTRLDAIPSLLARGGLAVDAIYDGWTRLRATKLSDSVLVVARPC
jgi:SAM-dependent methyltransferase